MPVDGADEDQRARYRDSVRARTPRTAEVLGQKTIIAADRIGTTEELVEALLADPSFRAADEFIVELPFELGPRDREHILTQWATRIAPALGWTPQR